MFPGDCTLRDWFAGQAMLSSLNGTVRDAGKSAAWCYAQADSMLVARKAVTS